MGIQDRVGAAWRGARGDDRSGPPQAFPPGEFYSPVVDASLVLAEPDRGRIWPEDPSDPPGIDMRADEQLALLHALAAHPFDQHPSGRGPQYDPTNDQFPPHDAAISYAMLRHLRPARVLEVGCGWSTTVAAAAIRDGGLATELTCIEPYPRDFLHELAEVHELRVEKVEHTPQAVFDELGSGDVLFIDSSHVVKTGSDVTHLFLEVVPRLADGVVVHVHDIFIPEDYPPGWVEAGFGWNEQYVLQAYLSGNARARPMMMNRWLARRHRAALRAALGPLPLDGSSVWFRTGRAERDEAPADVP